MVTAVTIASSQVSSDVTMSKLTMQYTVYSIQKRSALNFDVSMMDVL